MNRLVRWAVVLSMSVLVGCASKPVVYPEYQKAPTISVSNETVSTMTETPAEDYLIPGSQVFVAGKGGASRYLALVGVAMDKSSNESAISGNANAFRVTFKDQLSQALKLAGENSGHEPPIAVVESGGDVLMLPSARLVLRDDSNADLSFRVTVRFKDLASGDEGRKEYFYPYGLRPLAGEGGWAQNNSASFKQASGQAMGRLALVILEDLAGRYRETIKPANQRSVRWKPLVGETVVTGLLLKDEPDYLVVMRTMREPPAAATGVIGVMPKSNIRLQP